MSKIEFWAGGYAEPDESGILRCRLDDKTGETEVLSELRGVRNPSWVLPHPNGAVLYCVEECGPEGMICVFGETPDTAGTITAEAAADVNPTDIEGGEVSAYHAEWRLLARIPSGGSGPCHLALDKTATHLVVSNYNSGSLTLFAVSADGRSLTNPDICTREGVGAHPDRQEGPHIHFSTFAGPADTDFYTCDLGLDELLHFSVQEEKLVLRDAFHFAPGTGPRHFAVSPERGLLYLVSELSLEVFVLRMDGTGKITELQQAALLKATDNVSGRTDTAAAIKLTEDGRFLFVSVRGEDKIHGFRILPNGFLQENGSVSVEGECPRDFAVWGRWLLCANQEKGGITVFRV